MHLRRTITHIQTTYEEGGRTVATPTKLVAALAIIKKPSCRQGYVQDQAPETKQVSPKAARLLTEMHLDMTGDKLEGFGKTPVVGTGGEIEHTQAIAHSLWFGNQTRDAEKSKNHLAFTNCKGGPGQPIMILLMDKDDVGRGSHSQIIHTNISDAPGPNEFVVALDASIQGHPQHRIRDRYQGLKDMNHDVDNPAGV